MTEQEKLFEDWWQADGKFIDPDTSDVPWFDKRKALAALAFEAAMLVSRNYVADEETAPDQITFTNGRIVTLGDDGSLKVNLAPVKPRKRISPI